jgi:plasmid maintenance system antidote protein VapI
MQPRLTFASLQPKTTLPPGNQLEALKGDRKGKHRELGASRRTVTQLVARWRNVTAKMALRLARYFETSAHKLAKPASAIRFGSRRDEDRQDCESKGFDRVPRWNRRAHERMDDFPDDLLRRHARRLARRSPSGR